MRVGGCCRVETASLGKPCLRDVSVPIHPPSSIVVFFAYALPVLVV